MSLFFINQSQPPLVSLSDEEKIRDFPVFQETNIKLLS